MYFYTTGNYTFLLFREWKVTSISGVSGSFVAVLALAVLYESVKALNVTLRLHHNNSQWRESFPKQTLANCMRVGMVKQCSNTCLFVTELCLANFLMLVAMTYNTWFFLAVVIGRGLGYYLITPLIASHDNSEETGDYCSISPDFQRKKQEDQPLVQNTDV
ncbi:protein SLC31A2-like [Montipora capricornis]|uniref:protein SLC31A2-like n=1 Tax=Montipora capricornis TaxID=246305 RepID=UPI0035F1F7AB